MAENGHIVLKTAVDVKGVLLGLKDVEKIAKNSAKVVTAAITSAVTASAAAVKSAINAYSEYEQLTGGIETLFGTASDKMMEYADMAYQTSGLSANEYMQNVTSFSAALIKSVGKDTELAADVANQAMIDIADNVNKMGSSYESVQMAFQGFAKQQYMLLDNLKLGYGGTKTEMERLLKDAEAITKVKYDIDNLADVYSAIHVIQTELGITGTTALEAEKTIQGSAGMMKASFKNLLTAVSGGGDLSKSIENLSYAFEKWIDNIKPAIVRTLTNAGEAISQFAPYLMQKLVEIVINATPALTNAVYQMFIGLYTGLINGIKDLLSGQIKSVTEDGAKTAEKSTKAVEKNVKKTAAATKKAAKEAKKMTASFDELNILSQKTAESAEDSIDAATAAATASGVTPETNIESPDVTPQISEQLSKIMEIAGGAMIAVGLLLVFTGNVVVGLGLIAFGAMSLYTGVTSGEGGDPTLTVQQKLALMGEYVSAALVTIGIILLIFGNFPLGLGFIVSGSVLMNVSEQKLKEGEVESKIKQFFDDNALLIAGVSISLVIIGILLCFTPFISLAIGLIAAGAGVLASEIALSYDELKRQIVDFFKDNAGIIAGVSIALLVIGILLCFTPCLPLAIGLIAVGAVGLAADIALNWNSIKSNIAKFFKENAGLIVGVSLALLVLGIILCFTPLLPLGIGLIAVGAAGLAAEIAINWDFIKEKISNAFNAVINWLKTWGLLVLGVILCFTVVGIPLGIALIKKATENFSETEDPVWDMLLIKLKEAWESIKKFYNEHIKEWFTLEKWKELAGKIGDGLKMGIEAALNGIITLVENCLNFIVDNLNKISIDVPDDIPVIGGKKFGFDLPRVSIPRVALAKGGIVPTATNILAGEAGKEAVLPLERNTEWMDLLAERLAEKIGGGSEITVNFAGTEARLIRYLAPKITQTNKYRGKNILTGGQI